ncbi:MAG TPA: hypothetical protein VMM37_06855, partial [Bacteroidota bacterium]|nr:hypothetical protein [Bacteroidota bacterium]
MNTVLRKCCFISFVSFLFCRILPAQSVRTDAGFQIPHLEKQGSATHLVVNGQPLLMLAGETGNSSASDPGYMDMIWPKAV